MNPEDPAVLAFLRRSMVARIATLSRKGRPSVTPLYFILRPGRVWLGTAAWTLAARDVEADPRVTLLFSCERAPAERLTLRITGRASIDGREASQRAYVLASALKYVLNPGGLWNHLLHPQAARFQRRYREQSRAKGPACVIDVIPEFAEFLTAGASL